mmetsp:Transcript_35734/g.111496  ORF Transcript_35734/g.111496 Transcript_35734/m.111496 type:complete len:236 (+) Transcript_35734:173-880(+)
MRGAGSPAAAGSLAGASEDGAVAAGSSSAGSLAAALLLPFLRPLVGVSRFGRGFSSTSPASLSNSLMVVSPGVSSSLRVSMPVSTSLRVSRLLIVSSVSDAASLRPVASVSDAPLPLMPVSEATEEASDRYFFRSNSSPGGLGLLQTGRAGAPIAWMLMACTGFPILAMCFVPWLMTEAAFAISCSSGMPHRPNFTPTQTPPGKRSGVPCIALRNLSIGFSCESLMPMGTFSVFL